MELIAAQQVSRLSIRPTTIVIGLQLYKALQTFGHYPTLAPGGGWLFFALKYGLSVFVRQLCV